ncbi:hypothetical protein EPUS_06039 [Endocarpon pusillum Z07020]|uniref:SET domain-containing protein n=1 Tax=Endocarpon pusillum (strain Z07020 / HMAS-L-300199) TaxID=1263415 RepID=U1HPS8_ENDPU|nr:uncharacterized protein EPUS_06039 [Endocarpon pusillum Z07020]ERF72410.1 hypothetical protein EPUS_06039 [Endocarpon pusillum Z07020]
MTETSSSIATYPSQHPIPVAVPSVASPTLNGGLSDAVMQDDTEDYTIKCICSYGDDDGNTVYCEKCDTWQHIVCYYHGEEVPEVHFCADCDPRQLDAKRATESQKRMREHVGGADRKAKRPPQKSHKKKKDSMATPEQTNGLHLHSRHESVSAARDQPPPAKRAKTSHRTSASIVSMNGVPTLPEPRKRASSNVNAYPSPTKSPLGQPLHPPIPTYTTEFLNLYDNDRGKNNIDDGQNARTYSNSMSMAVTNKLTSWYDNPFALKQDTGKQHQEVFHHSDQPLRPETWPRVVLKEKTNTETQYAGRFPKWKCIMLDTNVKKDEFIGEIRGDIGLFEDYCFDPDTRWSELRHPEPFVFFHPQIPIYIDSRAEGTQLRYVRRSCHPNVSLKTFVTGERDFHHCFVAKENIIAGTELTIMWYLDQIFLNNGRVKEENGDEEEAKRRATYFSKILANFGDCACDSMECSLKNFDLRTSPEYIKKGRKWRGRIKSAASPISTGQATNSRANSEHIQMTEEEDQIDSRSTSGSIRSKPQSRDITPAHPGHTEQGQDPSLGMSAREKRKILMAEKAFEDQESKKHKAKRKRTSNGPVLSTPTPGSKNATTSLPVTPSLMSKPPNHEITSTNHGTDSPTLNAPLRHTSNTSPHKSSTPNIPKPPPRYKRPAYVDRGMQTDPEPKEEETEEPERTGPQPEWFKTWQMPHVRRTKMYQEWERKDRIKWQELKKKVEAGLASPSATIVPTWLEERREEDKRRAERRAVKEAKEKEEAAAAAIVSPFSVVSNSTSPTEESKPTIPASAIQLPPPPLPSQAAHTHQSVRSPNDHKLQLSSLPPVPTFTNPASSGAQSSTALSPTPTTPSVPQSPFAYGGASQSYPALSAGAVAPSPVKKKLSLGDYMSRRSNLVTPAAEKTQTQAMATTSPTPTSGAAPDKSIVEQAPSNPLAADPTPPAAMANPVDPIKVEAQALDYVEGPVVTHRPVTKDESAFVPPPALAAVPNQPSAAPSMPPALSSVLSNLHALAGHVARRDSAGS